MSSVECIFDCAIAMTGIHVPAILSVSGELHLMLCHGYSATVLCKPPALTLRCVDESVMVFSDRHQAENAILKILDCALLAYTVPEE